MFPTPFLLQFTKNLCHRDDNEAKIPRGLGSAADLFHRVQHRFAEFNFNCLYVDCMTESSVLFVNWSVVTVIRLQNSYKQKKLFLYASIQNLRTFQSFIQLGFGQFSPRSKTVSSPKIS